MIESLSDIASDARTGVGVFGGWGGRGCSVCVKNHDNANGYSESGSRCLGGEKVLTTSRR